MKKLISAFTLILISACLTLGLAEAVLRKTMDHYYLREPNMRQVFYPSQEYMRGVTGESRFFANADGIRADPLDGSHDYQILAVGGSTTENLYLDQEESWPYVLQSRLRDAGKNAWVGNAGKSGLTTRGHILQLIYMLPRFSHLNDIVMLVGFNDFVRRLRQDNEYTPILSDEDEARLLPDPHDVFSYFPAWEDPNPTKPLYQKTALWELLRIFKRKYFTDPTKVVVQDQAGNWIGDARDRRRNATALRDQLPDMAPALQEYRHNLNRLIDLAGKQNARLTFVTQPYLWSENAVPSIQELYSFGDIGPKDAVHGNEYYSVEAMITGMNMYNNVLLEVCKERSVPCIDLAGTISGNPAYFYDDCHFNEAGAAKVGEIVAEYYEKILSK